MSLTQEQNELFEENKNLAYATVHRRFSNPVFHDTHGISKEDLFQYGLIGLYNACKNYDASKGIKFSSFAINNIVWCINVEARRDSISNVDSQSFELLDKASLDYILYESEHGEETTMHDILEYREDRYSELELNDSIDSLDEHVGKGLTDMVRLRMENHTFKEIGEKIGMTHQGVRQRLMSNKDKIMDYLLNS